MFQSGRKLRHVCSMPMRLRALSRSSSIGAPQFRGMSLSMRGSAPGVLRLSQNTREANQVGPGIMDNALRQGSIDLTHSTLY